MSDGPVGKTTAKRACDACKVRKVRCSGIVPCTGCVAVGVSCTFNKHPRTRGPQKLRAKTIQQIVRSQGQRRESEASQQPVVLPVQRVAGYPSATVLPKRPGPETPLPPLVASPLADSPESQSRGSTPTPVATLVLQLCVYRLRMFPVWPIVAVDDLMAALQKDSKNMEIYALANAVGAATIAQLKLNPVRNSAEVVTRNSMEAEVQRILSILPMKSNLNRVRTAFFLHVYHENLEPGGVKSLLHLREAITMAQIIGLHRESSYKDLSAEDQQFRRRVLWLLFITERGVALLHNLPVVLKSNISFPAMEYNEEVSILPAFRKLVNLFWIFDQSGAFDILEISSNSSSTLHVSNQNVLPMLQKRLQEIPVDSGATNDVQAADISVTRAWMRAFLWRKSIGRGLVSSSADQISSWAYPIEIANEFLAVVSKLPSTAIEAHGPAMELKIYEIACSVTDSISRQDFGKDAPQRDVLDRLQRILSSCRGGSKTLIERLNNTVAEVQSPRMLVEPSPQLEHASDDQWLRENGRPSEPPTTILTNAQLESHEDNTGRFGSAAIINGGNVSLDLSQVAAQQQQFTTFNWDALAEETQGPGFGGTFDNIDPSAAIDRFLRDTMEGGVREILAFI